MNAWTTPQVIQFLGPGSRLQTRAGYVEDSPQRATENICSISSYYPLARTLGPEMHEP